MYDWQFHLLLIINNIRIQNNLKELVLDNDLCELSNKHIQNMISKNKLYTELTLQQVASTYSTKFLINSEYLILTWIELNSNILLNSLIQKFGCYYVKNFYNHYFICITCS
jgi:hypothetical protein